MGDHPIALIITVVVISVLATALHIRQHRHRAKIQREFLSWARQMHRRRWNIGVCYTYAHKLKDVYSLAQFWEIVAEDDRLNIVLAYESDPCGRRLRVEERFMLTGR